MTYAAYLETEECNQYLVAHPTWQEVIEEVCADDFETDADMVLVDVFVVDNCQRREDLELELKQAVLEFIKQQQENV